MYLRHSLLRMKYWERSLTSDMPATTHPTYLITQVWVDPAYRGQGIAGQLTTAFLAEVRQRTGYVIPRCPYAKAFIAKHPEFQDLIAK